MRVVSASSLIFVVVIAIWATYLLFHVTRRREHLATARSVDRFSAHMRVLQRRASRGATAPASHTSSVTLVRAVAATTPYDVQAETPDAAGSGRLGTRTSPPPRSEMPVSSTPRQVAAVGINRGFALLGRITAVPGSTVRRHALLAGLGAVVMTLLGVVLGLLSWRWFALSLLAVVAVLGWSRSSVTSARAVFERRSAALRQAGGPFPEESDSVYRGYDDRDLVPAVSGVPMIGGASDQPGRRAGRDDVFDVAQAEDDSRPGPLAAGRGVKQEPDTGGLDPLGATAGWAPVPVPLPTYAMKARAERPIPPPMPLAVPVPVPVPIEIDDEFDQWQRDTRGGQAAVNG